MAITNHERVGNALELLKAGLTPFVEREFKAKFGDGWAFEMRDALSDTRLGANKDATINDVAALDATKDPTGAIPVVALQIDTHVRNHVTAAPTATLSSGLPGGQPRCLGTQGVHVNLLAQV